MFGVKAFLRFVRTPLIDRRRDLTVDHLTSREVDLIKKARAFQNRFIPETPIVVSQEANGVRESIITMAGQRVQALVTENAALKQQLIEATAARDDLLNVLLTQANCPDSVNSTSQRLAPVSGSSAGSPS